MIHTAEVEDRLRRTFDAVAATTRVGLAPRGRERSAFKAVHIAALLAAVIAAGIVLLFTGDGATRTDIRTENPASPAAETTVTTGMRSILGMLTVASEDGVPVGYVSQSLVHPSTHDYLTKVNARTLWPVTDAQGVTVGYVAPDVPFIPRATVEEPGFDLEKVRAARNGECEDQIGDPNFKQEFPLCHNGNTER